MATASTAHLTDIVSSLNPVGHRTPQRITRHGLEPSLPSLPALPEEDGDAALTGSTRSLTRRLSALNLHAQVAQPLPATSQHPYSPALRRSA